MSTIVIGSGITGSNVALSLLKKGEQVELWDYGKQENLRTYNDKNFVDFKKNLQNSSEALIGNDKKSFPTPADQKLFEIPPLRNFILDNKTINDQFSELNNFDIYQSFNEGGLANGWGANCIPYNENEISDWNLDYNEFNSSQKKMFDELNVSKVKDSINTKFNFLDFGTENAITLDERDNHLLKRFSQNYNFFSNEKFEIGKARLAIKNSSTEDSCKLTSRCLWGCPQNAIYNPFHHTLKKCRTFKQFKYFNNRKVSHFNLKDGNIDEIIFYVDQIEKKEKVYKKVFLCAGAIQSGIIFNKTCLKNKIDFAKITTGLMDTKKIKIVYLLPKMIKKK